MTPLSPVVVVTGANGLVGSHVVAALTERGATRADDRFTEASMEDRKREGYF